MEKREEKRKKPSSRLGRKIVRGENGNITKRGKRSKMKGKREKPGNFEGKNKTERIVKKGPIANSGHITPKKIKKGKKGKTP